MSDSITLTDAQTRAIRDIKDWFENRTGEQQVFRVFGYAGTGKSTLVNHAIADLGLETAGLLPDVYFGTFTGKAAHVLRRKGVPCRTIHSLIYAVREATEEEIKAAKAQLERLELNAIAVPPGIERTMIYAQIEALRSEVKHMKRPRFSLNPDSVVRNCKLIVLDEVSMVGQEMAADLLSFGKPILVLGDPGQLPPIKGEGAFTQQNPDVLLTEIHRQAAESAIIRLATMARESRFIPYGKHDEFVWKMSRRDVEPAQLLSADQVICGLNASRLELNNAMRIAAGFGDAGALPSGQSEKVICLKNDNAIGLINGMFIQLDSIEPIDEERFRACVYNEDGELIGGYDRDGVPSKLTVYSGHFNDHRTLDPERHDRDWKVKRKLVEATYGWAITCHKSQGSSWSNIAIWDDGLGRTREARAQWLYTAITRAESGLVILD